MLGRREGGCPLCEMKNDDDEMMKCLYVDFTNYEFPTLVPVLPFFAVLCHKSNDKRLPESRLDKRNRFFALLPDFRPDL